MKEPKGQSPNSYTAQALRAWAMPLGGIGTGSIALCGDGSLRQWQIVNQVNHLAHVPHSFFGVRCEVGKGRTQTTARLLQTDSLHHDPSFQLAPAVTDHVLPSDARALLEALPSVGQIEAIGQYPIAQLSFRDPALPIAVFLEAYSPFIPLNAHDSGLPCIIFDFRVENPLHEPAHVSLLATLQNLVGWDGVAQIKGVSCPLYGGNQNTVIRLANMTAVNMSSQRLPPYAPGFGQVTLSTLTDKATALSHWAEPHLLWRDFESDGALEESHASPPSPDGQTWNAAIAIPLHVEPDGETRATVIFSWYFPNRYVNWPQEHFGVRDRKSMLYIGNYYNNHFRSALSVAEYIRDNHEGLRQHTQRFRNTFYDSTISPLILDSVSSQISTIRTPTCFRTEDGNFFGFEGCRGASNCPAGCATQHQIGGCCPLNCTHVWNYEQTLAKLFPALERTMRSTDLTVQMNEQGGIPHRTVLPLYLKRWSNPDPTASPYAADGHCGTILKTYREYRQSGGRRFLDELWPYIKKAIQYAVETWDADDDGVFDGPQWNTYDCHLYGHNSFISSLFLAALRAGEEMAKIQGEHDIATAYRKRYETGRRKIDQELWNGEYYIQTYNAQEVRQQQYATGCHADQLLGQWWAHILDLGYILDREHVNKALQSIFKYNFRDDLVGHRQRPRIYLLQDEPGLLICTWPHGGEPEKCTNYSHEVWTGIEYSTAGLMLFEGMLEEALKIIKAVRTRHDGTKRSPWNDVECGDHYVRPMSSWALLEAISGFKYNADERFIAFRPKVERKDFRCFFIVSRGWGTFAQKRKSNEQWAELSIASGQAELRTIELAIGPRERIRSLKTVLSDSMPPSQWIQKEERVLLTFEDPVTIRPGVPLNIEIYLENEHARNP